MRNAETFGVTAVACVVIVAIWIGFMFAFQALWNWVGHGTFGLPELSFWQAVGVYVLLSLIGGFFRASKS